MDLSSATTGTAGILLLTVALIEYGGTFMLKVVRRGNSFTGLQKTFFRAGHAHAGVLVLFSLIALLYADSLTLSGWSRAVARSAIPLSAILMPAGFFVSAMGKGVTRPNRWIVLLYLGGASLGVGVITLGILLLTA